MTTVMVNVDRGHFGRQRPARVQSFLQFTRKRHRQWQKDNVDNDGGDEDGDDKDGDHVGKPDTSKLKVMRGSAIGKAVVRVGCRLRCALHTYY